MDLVVREGADVRRENLPTATDVAALIDPQPTDAWRYIVLARRGENGTV